MYTMQQTNLSCISLRQSEWAIVLKNISSDSSIDIIEECSKLQSWLNWTIASNVSRCIRHISNTSWGCLFVCSNTYYCTVNAELRRDCSNTYSCPVNAELWRDCSNTYSHSVNAEVQWDYLVSLFVSYISNWKYVSSCSSSSNESMKSKIATSSSLFKPYDSI